MAQTTLNQTAADARPPVRPPSAALAGRDREHLVILALDLGLTTGWALSQSDGAITSGTVAFRTDRWQGGGIRYLRFKRWLTEIKALSGGLDLVVYEEVRRHAGVDASHVYGGFLATLTAWCEHHGLAYESVPVGTIKRHIAGKGNADKQAVIEAVRARGYVPADDNEADALAILFWALANGIGSAA